MAKIQILSPSGQPIAVTEKAFQAVYAPKGYVLADGVLTDMTRPRMIDRNAQIESLGHFQEKRAGVPGFQVSDVPPGFQFPQPNAVNMETGQTVSAAQIAEKMFADNSDASGDTIKPGSGYLLDYSNDDAVAEVIENIPGAVVLDDDERAAVEQFRAERAKQLTEASNAGRIGGAANVLTGGAGETAQTQQTASNATQTLETDKSENESKTKNAPGNMEPGKTSATTSGKTAKKQSNARK